MYFTKCTQWFWASQASACQRKDGEASACQCERQKEMEVQSLGPEDLLEEEMATHSSILAWKIAWKRSLVGYSPWGCKQSDMTEHATHTTRNFSLILENSLWYFTKMANSNFCCVWHTINSTKILSWLTFTDANLTSVMLAMLIWQ